ncbi:Cd(II)/Pb(II)-responsive transcriptional regulator [Ralstonia pickettii]|uniref:Cd(II)/Pb(II)-responsive transcriptional regulator n=1 Tax=Ralstonia pickettii TaxID=329 RepID=UPI0009B90191|nr:Cd(II)/Pb(II)-responsive transcriptional regulator [Ralstonia pickettii]
MDIRIGELAKRTGCEVVTIRYYEKEGLLPEPARSGGNFRLYGDEHVERLQFIRHCRSLDMTLNEIKMLLDLRDRPTQDCGRVNTLLDEHIRQVEVRVVALLQLKAHLLSLRESCSGSRPIQACGILQGLADCQCRSTDRNSATGSTLGP